MECGINLNGNYDVEGNAGFSCKTFYFALVCVLLICYHTKMKGGLRLNVVFYEKEDGTIPVADFINSLDKKMHVKTIHTLELLKEYGHMLRSPYSKELNDGIMELRISAESNISRILYFFVVGNTAILTNGFIKKTQKTPPNEIQRARIYRADYQRRNPSC